MRCVSLRFVGVGHGGYVAVRSVDMGYGELRSGKSVKFRQGPFGSVELRRVGARRLRLVMFCWVEVSFGRAVELG